MNPHCVKKLGHKTTNCIVYMDAKQEQYLDLWQGL
jgi:hypothetical protein